MPDELPQANGRRLQGGLVVLRRLGDCGYISAARTNQEATLDVTYKTRTAVSLESRPVLIVKLRTEHELVLTPDSLPDIVNAISSILSIEGVPWDDREVFREEFETIVSTYRMLSESRTEPGLESDWKPLNAGITFDILKLLDEKTRDLLSIRFEGTPETGYRLITNGGIQFVQRTVRSSADARAIADRAEAMRLELESTGRLEERSAVPSGTDIRAFSLPAAGATLLVIVAGVATGAKQVFEAMKSYEEYVEQREKARLAKAEADAAEARAAAERARLESKDKASAADKQMDRVFSGGAGGGLERAIGRL